MMKEWLISISFTFVKKYLLTDENIEQAREDFKKMITELVEDTKTEWDDEAAAAVLKFMYLDY